MPGPNNPFQYQYKPEDDPLTVASQFGITPQQLISANPGGTPFAVGQTIRIPQAAFQYSSPIGPQPNGQTFEDGSYRSANSMQPYAISPTGAPNSFAMRGRGYTGQTFEDGSVRPANSMQPYTVTPGANNQSLFDMRGRGYSNPQYSSAYGTDDSWYRPATGATSLNAPTQPAFDPTQPYGGFTNNDPKNTDYANTRAAQHYAAAGTPFLQQQRWDPQRRRYVSIGRLLRQGKLDLQGNWHRRGRGGGGGGGSQARRAQQAQDNTLANSLINFSASAG